MYIIFDHEIYCNFLHILRDLHTSVVPYHLQIFFLRNLHYNYIFKFV